MTALLEFCQSLAPTFYWESVNRFMRHQFASLDDALFELRYREMLKFLYLRSKYGKGFIPVTQAVDEMWHEFILQTQAYADLCAALPGQHFIHHNSVALHEYADERGHDEVIEDLLTWIPHYVQHFGPFTSEAASYWMIVNFLQEEMHLALSDINQLS
jgi:hypothetical protein